MCSTPVQKCPCPVKLRGRDKKSRLLYYAVIFVEVAFCVALIYVAYRVGSMLHFS